MTQPDNTYKVIPLSPLRKIIAARMTEAKQTIPHYRISVDIEMDTLLALRKQFTIDNPNSKVSVNDVVIKACANALMENPAINSQLIGDEIHQYQQADIAIVIAVDGGLSTPIVRHANDKSVQDISLEIKDLASRAAAGQLKMDEILGGSFSISNLGMYGVEQFDAIINPPQCAILAIGTAKQQGIVKDGELAIATMLRATLSLDHRAIDGASGAEFLAHLKSQLEKPHRLYKSKDL